MHKEIKWVSHFIYYRRRKLKHMKIHFSQSTKGLNAWLFFSFQNYRLTVSALNYRIKPHLSPPRAMTNRQCQMVMVTLSTLNHHRMPGNSSMLINPVHLANAVFIIFNPSFWVQRPINMLIHLLTILNAFQLVIIYRLSQWEAIFPSH